MRTKPFLDLTFRTPETLLSTSSSKRLSVQAQRSPFQNQDFNTSTSIKSPPRFKNPFDSPFDSSAQRISDSDYPPSDNKPINNYSGLLGSASFGDQLNGESVFFHTEFEGNKRFLEGRTQILRIGAAFIGLVTVISVIFVSYCLKSLINWAFNCENGTFWAWMLGVMALRIALLTSKYSLF